MNEDRAADKPASAWPEALAPSRRPAILLVDDDVIALEVMGSMLMDEFDVQSANSGRAALDLVQGGYVPNLVVLDLMMPEIDGYGVLNGLRAHVATRETPVIIVTSASAIEEEARALEIGAADFVSKPVHAAALLARVRSHLELAHSRMVIREHVQWLTHEATRSNEDLAALERRILDEADTAKGQFLSAMSDELRAPITGVLGMLQLCLEEPSLTDQVKDWLTQALDTAWELNTMVSEILNYGVLKKSTPPLQIRVTNPFAFLAALKEAHGQKADIKALRLAVKVDAAVPDAVMLDSEKAFRCLGNLLDNAIKFSEVGPIKLHACLVDNVLRFEVRDHGPGISAEQQALIFEPFHQVDSSKRRVKGGSGLGLSIARLLASAMQGEVKVESTPGEGSCFYLQVPLVEPDL